ARHSRGEKSKVFQRLSPCDRLFSHRKSNLAARVLVRAESWRERFGVRRLGAALMDSYAVPWRRQASAGVKRSKLPHSKAASVPPPLESNISQAELLRQMIARPIRKRHDGVRDLLFRMVHKAPRVHHENVL